MMESLFTTLLNSARSALQGGGGRLKEEERRAVAAGETYGHLEVVEELTGRDAKGSRRYRCRCLRVLEGRMCGNLTIKSAHQLNDHRFRACKECSEEYVREHRRSYTRGLGLRGAS